MVKTLTDFASGEQINNGYFRGIGAVDQLTCGHYKLPEQEYNFTKYNEPLEVVSLTGNIMLKDNEPFVHVHGVFTNTKNEALGGHIKEMRVAVTLEVILTPLNTNLNRELEESIGLHLINCP